MSSGPSLRQLADHLKLSHATVSEALRDSPRVKSATRERVLAAAAELGYRRNPLASALMGEMRRSRGAVFRGVLAALDVDLPHARDPAAAHHHEEVLLGAARQAEEMGFTLDRVRVDTNGYAIDRLTEVFSARGIKGVLVLPSASAPDLRRIDWSRFTSVVCDVGTDEPRLNTVCADYHGAMVKTLRHLHALGYRRPGLVLDAALGARHLHRWEAAYHCHFLHQPTLTDAPPRPLLLCDASAAATEFAAWFGQNEFDVVLAHRPEVMDWMRTAGARLGDTHGFCCLDLAGTTSPCAGLDLRPHAIGTRAAELLINQVMKNEYGEPDSPVTTLIPSAWSPGPTLRQVRGSALAA